MANRFLNNISINDQYTLPASDGNANQVLATNGSGQLSFVDQTGGASDTAERIEVTVKNVSGGSLSKGTVVHASPSATPPSGNVIEVIAADYDDSTKMPAIGILNETIANEGEGAAVMMGAVSGIDTSSFSIGDELYVGNLGTLTNTKPATSGQLIQKIAVVIKSHASNGLIKIFGAGRSNDVPLPLYIDNTNQRVGIGEPSPANTLHVNGRAVIGLNNTIGSSYVTQTNIIGYNNSTSDTGVTTSTSVILGDGNGGRYGNIVVSERTLKLGTDDDVSVNSSNTTAILDINNAWRASSSYVNVGGFLGYFPPPTSSNEYLFFSANSLNSLSTSTFSAGNAPEAAKLEMEFNPSFGTNSAGNAANALIINAQGNASSAGALYLTASQNNTTSSRGIVTFDLRHRNNNYEPPDGMKMFEITGGWGRTKFVVESGGQNNEASIGIQKDIFHLGDTDTFFGFTGADTFGVTTGGTERLSIGNSGATFSGSVTGSSFVKSGGTSSQFLKADGSVDSSTYLTSFDITTQTDGKYLRSNANDTWSGDISTTSTNGIRFGSSNQTDTNDGFIAAGRFASGLNIVGTQTTAGTGRQIRLWGNLITNDGHAYWHANNDGSGSGLDADTLDGQHASAFLTAHPNISGATSQNNTGNGFIQDLTFDSNGHVTGVVSASVSGFASTSHTHAAADITSGTFSTARIPNLAASKITSGTFDAARIPNLNASKITSGTFSDLFAVTTRYNIGLIDGSSSQTRDKLRVWNSSSYTIGMKSGFTYGHLNDYAMSFQMNDDNDRGFWWGDTGHTDAQGAMSLTTNGRLTVAESISVGQGASVTSPSTFPLYVDGTAVFDTTSGTEPVCITRSGSSSAEVLKIGVSDRVAQFNYIEDTSSEGTGNFGEYQFILGGNSGETSVTPLKLEKTKTTSNAGAFTFGTPGNGTNTLGRWLSFEGNTDSSGEGSGRLFFSEHNSSTTDMDDYGMSIGYRGGSTSVTTAGGNTWTGLSAIGNGEWGMWGHNNSLAGTLIMAGPRSGNYVKISQSGGIRAQVFYDLNDTNYLVDAASTSYLKYIGRRAHETGLLVGGYNNIGGNSTSTNPIFTIGSSYLPATTTLGNMYGVGYTHTNASFISFTGASGWGMYVASDGDARIYLDAQNGRGSFKSGLYSTVYYDYSNTTYFVDAASTGDSIRVAGDVVAYYSSDKRYKENIKPIESPIEKVKAISGVTFEWNEKSHKETGKKDVGVIAQEVEEVLPEIVQTRDNGYKAVDYQKLTAVLIEAVKDQQKQIDELKSIINGSS